MCLVLWEEKKKNRDLTLLDTSSFDIMMYVKTKKSIRNKINTILLYYTKLNNIMVEWIFTCTYSSVLKLYTKLVIEK